MKFRPRKVLIMLLVFIFSPATFASDVFVTTDFSTGKGILREVGDSCFVYTPKHVVEDSDGIVIHSAHVKDAKGSVLTEYPQDLAILQVAPNYKGICRDSSWRDGGRRTKAILNGLKKVAVSFRKLNGSLTEYPARVSRVDLHTYFYIELENSKRSIIQGMSGSIVMVGEYPIGMLISVNDGEGKVLRMDSIHDISKSVMDSFASETELIAEASSDESAFPTIKSDTRKTDASLQTAGKWEFKGQISVGNTKELKIIAKGNTAYRLTSKKQSDSVNIRYQFVSPGGDVLGWSDYSTDDPQVFGFGTRDEGEHLLKVHGKRDGGTFHLILEEMATPEQLTGASNILGHGDVAKGYIGQNTTAIYKVIAKGNTAYRLTSKKQSDSVNIRYQFVSPGGKVLGWSDYSTDDPQVFELGSIAEGMYQIKLHGNRGGGTYHLTLVEVPAN